MDNAQTLNKRTGGEIECSGVVCICCFACGTCLGIPSARKTLGVYIDSCLMYSSHDWVLTVETAIRQKHFVERWINCLLSYNNTLDFILSYPDKGLYSRYRGKQVSETDQVFSSNHIRSSSSQLCIRNWRLHKDTTLRITSKPGYSVSVIMGLNANGLHQPPCPLWYVAIVPKLLHQSRKNSIKCHAQPNCPLCRFIQVPLDENTIRLHRILKNVLPLSPDHFIVCSGSADKQI